MVLPMEGLVSVGVEGVVPPQRWSVGSRVELALSLTSGLPATLKGCTLTLHLQRMEGPPVATPSVSVCLPHSCVTPVRSHRGGGKGRLWMAQSFPKSPSSRCQHL